MLTMPLANSPTPIHVALVEDDVNFQNAFIEALNGSTDLRLVAVATCRAEGLALLQAAPADVLVVDLGLPDGSGIDVIRAAAKLWPGCAVMVSTTFGDEMHVMQSLEAGAAGYLVGPAKRYKCPQVEGFHRKSSPRNPREIKIMPMET